jgi:hypothetical protein
MSFLRNLFGKQETAGSFQSSKPGVYELGILFDIDGLGGGFYGWQAYKVIFSNLDPKRLTACTLLDGDTKETLSGSARQYCIALQSLDPSKLSYVKETLSQCSDKGLLPPRKRFVEGNVTTQHPLAIAGEIDSAGNLNVKESSMIGDGWVKGTAWTVIKR